MYLDYAKHIGGDEHLTQWVKTTLKNHLEKHQLSTEEVEHVLDYLAQSGKRISKMSYPQAKKLADAWTKSLQKKGAQIEEKPEDTEIVLDFKDGFKIVKLIGENAYKREGFLMRHCVASYYGKDVEVYSLRDKDNMPHCTMEKDQQVKGKGNGDIHPKYVGYVVQFLEHVGMTVGDSEMRHLGYMNVEKIKDDLHKDIDLFNEKYVREDTKLLDKEGNEYASLDLLDIKPLIKQTTEAELKINFDLLPFIKASIDFLFRRNKEATDEKIQAASGYSSQLAASGDYSQLAASGDSSKLAASGYYSKLAASGDSSQLAASGDYSQLAASGDSSQLAASGDSSQLAASGYYSQLAASGDYSQLAAPGYSSKLAASGDYSKLAASGYYSKLAASGYSSQLEMEAEHSVAMVAGHEGRAKGKKGCWFALTEWEKDKDNDQWKPKWIKAAQIDGKKIKEDVWYKLENGKFVECE